jgi:hypothetical protein
MFTVNPRNPRARLSGALGVVAILLGLLVSLVNSEGIYAGNPFGKADHQSSTVKNTHSLAFDQVNWKRPQGVFTWIAMARGYKTPWDSVGRPGWMTDDAYVEPIDPGVSVFSPNTPEIYIVFEGQPLDAPGQFAAAWYEMNGGKRLSEEPVGTDIIELEMNQKYGYFILSPSEERWGTGEYLVELYYGSPGQQIHAINVVGTMVFTIVE